MDNKSVEQFRVGYIGLGNMGRELAANLARAGFPLTVFDVDAAAVEPFESMGADVANSPAEVASCAEVVFACLPTPEISAAVAFGKQGVIEGSAVKVYVENSTIGEAAMWKLAEELEHADISTLDAPVSGGPHAVRTGRTSCFVSGPRKNFEQVRSALQVLAAKLFYVGEAPGQSQLLKVANNLLNSAHIAIASEMLHMVIKGGIDPYKALEVINASSGRSRATEELLGAQMLSGNYRMGAHLSILQKDAWLANEAAKRLGVFHKGAQAVHEIWDAAVKAGYGEHDVSEIYRYIGAMATGESVQEKADKKDNCPDS